MDMGLSLEQIKELGKINDTLLKSLLDAEVQWNPIVIYTTKIKPKHIFYLVDPIWGHLELRRDKSW